MLEPAVEFGEWHDVSQGRRTDVRELQQAIASGATERVVVQEYFGLYLRHRTNILAAMAILNGPPARDSISVVLYIGPPGVGKSRLARHNYPNAFWQAPISGSSTFFTGYTGEDTIVLDEFRGWLPFGFLLRLLDRYPLQLPGTLELALQLTTLVHGSTVACRATTIVLTTNRHPNEWYATANRGGLIEYGPLHRRFTEIQCIHSSGETEGEWFTDGHKWTGTNCFNDFDDHWFAADSQHVIKGPNIVTPNVDTGSEELFH